MARGMADVDLPYGGDITLQANGDPVLIVDTPEDPAATKQWLIRLINAVPRVKGDAGTFIARADDLFYPDWGGGAPAMVGEDENSPIVAETQTRMLRALTLSPYIADVPVPVVTVTSDDAGDLFVSLSCTSVTGEPIAISQYPLASPGA